MRDTKTKYLIARTTPEEKENFMKYLKSKGMKFSDWVRRTMYITIENN
jgi:hypothetical protein